MWAFDSISPWAGTAPFSFQLTTRHDTAAVCLGVCTGIYKGWGTNTDTADKHRKQGSEWEMDAEEGLRITNTFLDNSYQLKRKTNNSKPLLVWILTFSRKWSRKKNVCFSLADILTKKIEIKKHEDNMGSTETTVKRYNKVKEQSPR